MIETKTLALLAAAGVLIGWMIRSRRRKEATNLYTDILTSPKFMVKGRFER